MPKTSPPGKSYSLKGQLGILVAALVIPLLALQGWWSFRDYQTARERARDDALSFADATALGVKQFLAQSEALMTSTVRQRGAGWVTAGDCTDEMVALADLFPFLSNILTVAPSGDILCSAVDVPADASAAEWPWFADFIDSGTFIVGPPVLGDFTETWILPLVTPIQDADGRVGGALVGTVPLDELSNLLEGITPPKEHLITIATSDRVVLARSHDAAEHVGTPLPPLTGSDILIGPGRSVATGPDLNGLARTWGQIQIDPGWLIYVGVPDDVVYGPAVRNALFNAAATLLIAMLGILLAGRSYARIATALRKLADGTGATASGDIVPLPPDTPSEVTAVVEQFNTTLRGRDRAEAAERAARERFQSIFDNAVFGLCVSTTDGRFLEVNPALAEMLGYESVDALVDVGPAPLYMDPSSRDKLLHEWLKTGRVATHELDWLRADGVPITVRIGGKLIRGPDGDRVFEMIVQDVTEAKRTEDQLRQTQKMEAVGKLAGGIAHDFNNLLTVIGGNAELLEDDLPDDDACRADLHQITKATARAASLTRRLLSVSRKGTTGAVVLDINGVVSDLERMLERLMSEDTELRTRLAPDPLSVSIDPGELEHMLLNLVINARDAMPEGGRILIETRRATTGGAPSPETAEPDTPGREGALIRVSDTGIGMDDIVRSRVFEPFYTTKPMGKGTGLGLSTVYGIVNRAGGTIRLESEPGVGTSAEIWLPLSRTATQPHSTEPDSMDDVTGTETILVVEDDELVRAFVQRALTEAGFEVLPAEDGTAAMELIRARSPDLDLVLTDMAMPVMSGRELAERLALVRPDVPVLFMSGYVDSPFLDAELNDRPDDLLRKPFSASELRSRVRTLLDRSAAATAGD